MPNRLANETSPYLLQHADNPVDWYPWGDEALERARTLDRPILLSIGYSACHWCHVMAHESFEDAATAEFMNENFVCIKVDREERPDVDDIYMEAVQTMTGQGGWPLTVFLDNEAAPFYGGTYYPPVERQGMPSFRMLMEAVIGSWGSQREAINEQGQRIRERIGEVSRIEPGDAVPGPELLAAAEKSLQASADLTNGGFGGAPKFPPASVLEFLLARGERQFVGHTLGKMASGGIHDQVGGGFARYSVDARWLVPHFEKMLYDNALLARVYLHGYQATGKARWREVCESTLDWMMREMRGPEGGFYSALDADSEGVEGKFYVWSEDELREALTEGDIKEVERILGWWGVSPTGNFEGSSILYEQLGTEATPPEELGEAKRVLREWREQRVRPGLDDKRICSWNALAIAALADAGAVLGRADYLEAARESAAFVLERMATGDGRLIRTWKERDGDPQASPRDVIGAYLEDYSYLADALTVLYEATLEERWYAEAMRIASLMIELFADPELGGFFTTANDADPLLARRKDVTDHPIPSGNSAAAYALLRLSALSGDGELAGHAESVLRLFARTAERHAEAVGHMLRALDLHHGRTREVALVAPTSRHELAAFEEAYRAHLRPHEVLAGGIAGADEPPLLRERPAAGEVPAAYVCENFACRAPVDDPAELARLLADG